jgi:hypothetical protein
MPLSPAVDGVWEALANDEQILTFKGLTPSSSIDEKVNYIVRSEETDGVITADVLPIILIFTRPGKPDVRTKQMYNDKIVVEVYAADAYKAQQIADRVFDVLHNAELVSPTFQVSACRFAYATTFRTGIPGIRGHRLWFDVSYFIG